MEKSILTAQLEDALEKNICPICYLTNDSEYSYLDSFLYERVNDGPTRAELRKSKGFCKYHSYRLIEVGKKEASGVNLGIAIVYKDLISSVSKELELADRKKIRDKDKYIGMNCPACRIIEKTEKTYIEKISEYISDEDLKEKYLQSRGLCMNHFYKTYDCIVKEEARKFLKEDQLKRLQLISQELTEYIRKQDYRFKDTPLGNEIDSWLRAIQCYAGVLKKS